VLGIVPVRGSQRFWGHIVVRTDLVNNLYRDEDASTTEDFADQLGRILDAADLLQHALAVERSLAHTEKLAAIGELAARIVHDIRNPVTAARSLAQQLARERGSPFAEEHAVILEELARVDRQIVDLLRFARRDELALEPVDLAELVREILLRLHPRLDAAGIAVSLDAPRALVVPADREKVRQVLINLIENAADALCERESERRIALEVGTKNGSSIVRLTDNGPGVPPDALARIFEPFFSSKAGGTGLGLAIAKRTIEAHGGHIAAENGAREGLCLALELPLGDASCEAQEVVR
jgi:signal transduction histidine kinase